MNRWGTAVTEPQPVVHHPDIDKLLDLVYAATRQLEDQLERREHRHGN